MQVIFYVRVAIGKNKENVGKIGRFIGCLLIDNRAWGIVLAELLTIGWQWAFAHLMVWGWLTVALWNRIDYRRGMAGYASYIIPRFNRQSSG